MPEAFLRRPRGGGQILITVKFKRPGLMNINDNPEQGHFRAFSSVRAQFSVSNLRVAKC